MNANDGGLMLQPPMARKAGTTGVPVRLADGREWLLARAGLAPALTTIRDRMYDMSVLRGSVQIGDVLQAAWVCLVANYDLTDPEIESLLGGADEKALADAVLEAVLGPDRPNRTYTSWALSSLIANGINPVDVPTSLVGEVLEQLVQTGRAIPQGEYIDAAVGAAKRRSLLSMAARLGNK